MRAPASYLGGMSILPPMVNPRAAMSDFAAAVRGDSKRDRFVAIALSLLITAIILIIFFVDAKINTAPPMRVTYVQTYAPGRTDADIVAQQQKDSAARKAAALEKQRQFQQLQKRLGIE